MRFKNKQFWIVFLILQLLPAIGVARKTKTISFHPDPSCNQIKLSQTIEKALSQHLRVENLKVTTDSSSRVDISFEYFILVRNQDDQVIVQLNGRAFSNYSRKLLAESAAESDPHSDEEKAKEEAAYQAGERLAQELSGTLSEALSANTKGRKVIIQVTLNEDVLEYRERILERLKRGLSVMSPRLRGTTQRSLTLLITATEKTKYLGANLEKILTAEDSLKVVWILQSKTSMFLRVQKNPPAS